MTGPARVGAAAHAHRLGALVTVAEADRRTLTRSWVLWVAGAAVLLGLIALLKYSEAVTVPFWPFIVLVAGVVKVVDRVGGRPGVVLHLFERGAVLDRPRRAEVRVVALADLQPTLRAQQGLYSRPRWVLTIREAGATVFTCTGREAVRLSDAVAAAVLADWSR